MKLITPLVVTFVIGLALAGCGGDVDQPSSTSQVAPGYPAGPEDAAHCRQLFVASCAACHGKNGEGIQGLGKSMQNSSFIAGITDDKLVAFIKQGRPATDLRNKTGIDMPPKGGNPALTDEQLMQIVAHIRSIQ